MKYCKASITDTYAITQMWREEQKEIYGDKFTNHEKDFDYIGLSLASQDNLFIVAKNGKKFVGFGHFTRSKTERGKIFLTIVDIWVNKSFRNQGAAEYFVKSAIVGMPEETIVISYTKPEDKEHKRVEKLGFKKRSIVWETTIKDILNITKKTEANNG